MALTRALVDNLSREEPMEGWLKFPDITGQPNGLNSRFKDSKNTID